MTTPPPSLRIRDDGVWTFDGEPVVHESVLALFKRSLRPAEAGGFELAVHGQIWPVDVEDTPVFVRHVRESGPGAYLLLLDDGSEEPLDPKTLRTDARGMRVRVRTGRFPARLTRNAYLDLAAFLVDGPGGAPVLPVRDGPDVVLEEDRPT